MTEFSVEGPFPVKPFIKGNCKFIGRSEARDFFKKHNKYSRRNGVYVFGKRTRSIVPYYIGMTTRGFSKEVFCDRNLVTFNEVIIKNGNGTPVIFFVPLPIQRGPDHVRHIGELENYLIYHSNHAWGTLLNEKKVNTLKQSNGWCINGIYNGNRKGITSAERSFKQILKL